MCTILHRPAYPMMLGPCTGCPYRTNPEGPSARGLCFETPEKYDILPNFKRLFGIVGAIVRSWSEIMPNLRSSVYGWKSVWMDLADEAKGEFTEENNVSRVRVPMSPWTVTFEMHAKGKEHSRILLPFEAKSDFVFEIYNRNWIADAQKTLGMQDIVVGYEEFDRDFIIKGSDESHVKKLFSAEPIREMIQLQKAVRLAIHKGAALKAYGKVPNGVHVLAFEEEEAINSFDRLVSLLELFRATMTQLCEMGVANLSEPDFEM